MTTIAVVGAGTMGRGIMQWAAEAGAAVLACDQRAGAAADAKGFIADLLARAVTRGRRSASERDAALARIGIVDRLVGLAGADIVIEAIVEDIEAKRQLFRDLEPVVGDAAILCTNTSSLSVTGCAADCRRPERVAGLHFFNPAPVMKVVEIVRGERTGADVIQRLVRLVRSSGHHPLVCADLPGFVVNHAGRGLLTEGLRIVQEGVGRFEDVDRVVRDVVGLPMGPFELLDLTGLDVSGRVLREIYDACFQEPRFRPSPLVYRRIEAGLCGRKTGAGFYGYADGRRVEPAETAPPAAVGGGVFVAGAARPLAERLAGGGLRPVASASDADIVVACPFGDDATTAAVTGGFDPCRFVAIDPLFMDRFAAGGRITLMPTPVTARDKVDAVHSALLAAGMRVTRIADSPGFVAQRVVASIVNTACEIAQQRIAGPADLDEGVRRGLGYPMGPLALGDGVGASRVLVILERLHTLTGDPRYRPSLWLRRAARLGIPLTYPQHGSAGDA